MSAPPREQQLRCPDGHAYTAVVIGDAVPECPACAARPVYGQVLSRLAGGMYTKADYMAALHAMRMVMPSGQRLCPDGHQVSAAAKFCPECGCRVPPA